MLLCSSLSICDFYCQYRSTLRPATWPTLGFPFLCANLINYLFSLDCFLMLGTYLIRFWKISPNVTFYIKNIYNQNEEHPINLKVVTICSYHLELLENNWKYFEKFCNPFAEVTINCVILNVTLRLIFQNRVTYVIYKKQQKGGYKAVRVK